MPIYSYLCKKCGALSELLVNSTDTEKPKCEKCGSDGITRTFSNFAVSSRGAGSCGGTPGDSCEMANNFPGCCPGCKK